MKAKRAWAGLPKASATRMRRGDLAASFGRASVRGGGGTNAAWRAASDRDSMLPSGRAAASPESGNRTGSGSAGRPPTRSARSAASQNPAVPASAWRDRSVSGRRSHASSTRASRSISRTSAGTFASSRRRRCSRPDRWSSLSRSTMPSPATAASAASEPGSRRHARAAMRSRSDRAACSSRAGSRPVNRLAAITSAIGSDTITPSQRRKCTSASSGGMNASSGSANSAVSAVVPGSSESCSTWSPRVSP